MLWLVPLALQKFPVSFFLHILLMHCPHLQYISRLFSFFVYYSYMWYFCLCIAMYFFVHTTHPAFKYILLQPDAKFSNYISLPSFIERWRKNTQKNSQCVVSLLIFSACKSNKNIISKQNEISQDSNVNNVLQDIFLSPCILYIYNDFKMLLHQRVFFVKTYLFYPMCS